MLKFIGIGSAFNTDLGSMSAYIKEKDSLLLIDCGGTVFDRLQKEKLLDNIKNLYVFVTHTHPDHIGSLGDIIFYAYYILKIKAVVLFPDKEWISKLLGFMGVDEETYHLKSEMEIDLNDPDFNDVSIKYLPASHVETIPCFGIQIEKGNESIFYSGDANVISDYVLEGLRTGKIDKLYQDTSGADYEGNYHLSLRKLTEVVEPGLRHKVYCMHLDKYFDREKAIELGFQVVQL